MFTGIVQGTAKVVSIDDKPNFRTHVIRMPSPAWGEGLALGASVAHNGCCLTVTRVEGDLVSFDLMQETLRLTNLGQLVVGDKVVAATSAAAAPAIPTPASSSAGAPTEPTASENEAKRAAQSHALALDGPVVAQIWPAFYTGPRKESA